MESKQTLLLNAPESCVDEMLSGLCRINNALYKLPGSSVLVDGRRASADSGSVAIVSGGGSGHEPFAAGYVGRGMLAAAVAGSVFASPPAATIERAIRAVSGVKTDGVLVLVYNYTGDRINFGRAVERCRDLPNRVEIFIVQDDSAMTSLEDTAGRRGLCGGMLLIKIVGALAERGASLDELLQTCDDITKRMATLGVAAGGCTLPGASDPLFTVPPGMLELGLGVHGEAGVGSLTKSSAKEVVATVLEHMLNHDSHTGLQLAPGDQVVVLINNLGSMSHLEMLVITNEVASFLEMKGIIVERMYSGHFMTSLDMRGFHVTLLHTSDHLNWLELLDAPTDAPVWQQPCRIPKGGSLSLEVLTEKLASTSIKQLSAVHVSPAATLFIKSALHDFCTAAPSWTARLNELDSGCGDGDCGSTLTLAATTMALSLDQLPCSEPIKLLDTLAQMLGESMGGTSGGLYSIMFSVMSTSLSKIASQNMGAKCAELSVDVWLSALSDGVAAVMKYGGAKPGDRTMLDAICPAIAAAKNQTNREEVAAVLKALADAADVGATATSTMKARAGRASYVRGGDARKEDAGARAVALILASLAQTAKQDSQTII